MSPTLQAHLVWQAAWSARPRLVALVAGLLLAGCAGDFLPPPTTSATPPAQDPVPAASGRSTIGSPPVLRPTPAATAGSTPSVATTAAGRRQQGFDALAAGDLAKAERLLRQAIDPGAPDWRVHSGLGVALAAAGKQQAAQIELAKALALAPEHPAILNNLALSYVLDGRPEAAEPLLRRIAPAEVSPQVRLNLALVLGARGQHEEARRIAGEALPAGQAEANRTYVASLGPPRRAAE